MKTLCYVTIVCISTIFILVSCESKNKSTQKKSENMTNTPLKTSEIKLDTQYLFSLDQAQEDMKRFSKSSRIPLKGFTLRTYDLLSALGVQVDSTQLKYQHVRGYLGQTASGAYKFFIVGVNGANLDPSHLEAGTDDTVLFNGKSYLYDLNVPCPSICGSLAK